jgi:quinol-cytochrome oxidoreductase complex cytochrome b subunit
VLATWRYLHRWVAVLVVVLIVLHVAYVSIYGSSSLLETGS